MKKRIFHLRVPDLEPVLIKSNSLIVWLDYIGADAIATPDLICLVEQFYYPN